MDVGTVLQETVEERAWHMNMKINQVVVMYLDGDQIVQSGLSKDLSLTKTVVWGCVQARAQWSTEEDAHIRPGHHWLCEFGDAGNGTSCEKQFNLDHRKCEDYRGTHFYNKDSALVIKRWLNRVDENTSGLTFQEWTPDVDTSRPPVAMLINSSELRAAGFKLKEVIPPALESQLHVVASGHEERDCEVLRSWALKSLFCQWMMTLNSGHDVSEKSLFVH